MESFRTKEDEILLLHDNIRDFDNSIHQLKTQRAIKLRRLNDLRSTTAALPPEILSFILQCTPLDSGQQRDHRPFSPAFPFVLGQVSSLWRQVTWSTPQLWTVMNVGPLHSNQIEPVGDMLETFLTNVSHLPFSLKLDLRNVCGSNCPVNRLTRTLFHEELGQKIHNLHLSSFPPAWMVYFSESQKFNELMNVDNLFIDRCSWASDFSLAGVARIQKLSIQQCIGSIKLPSQTLTVIDLNKVPIDICIELLVQCPNLVICRNPYPQTACRWYNEDVVDRSPITFRHLGEFSWGPAGISDSHTSTLVNRLQLPALKMFSWNAWSGNMHNNVTFLAILPKIRNSLTTLSLMHIDWSGNMIEDVLRSLRGLEHLHLTCSTGAGTFIRKLRWTSERQYSPALRSLRMSRCPRYHWKGWYPKKARCSVELYGTINEDIFDMLNSRFRDGGCTSFRIDLEDIRFTQDPTLREMLQELVSSGFVLEVIENCMGSCEEEDEVSELSEDSEDSDSFGLFD